MDVDLTRDDVVGTYAGLRPLVAPVRRLDRQGLARAPGDRRGERRRARSAAASTRPTGSWPATSSTASSVPRPPRRARATPPSDGSSAPPTPMPWPASPAELMTIPAIRDARPGGGGPARRAPRHGGARRRRPRAPSATCCGRSSPAARSSRPRSCGRSVTSSRCRSTTSSLAGRGWPRSCRTVAPRSRRASRRSWPATSTGETPASRLEVETYLAGARREFSVAPAGEAGPPDGAVTTAD